MKSEDDFKLGGKEVTYNRLKQRVKEIQKKRTTMEKKCGNCKFFIPHRKDKRGFEGKCQEIVIMEEMTNILTFVNLTKEDPACTYFESKSEDI